MRVQLASDLHCEFLERGLGKSALMPAAPDADLLVLAGDIGKGARWVELLRDWPVPVVLVAGNHELYRGVREQVLDDLRRATQGTNVHFLERDALTLGGVRFFGCTLWTDYLLDGPGTRSRAMERLERALVTPDHRCDDRSKRISAVTTACTLIRRYRRLSAVLSSPALSCIALMFPPELKLPLPPVISRTFNVQSVAGRLSSASGRTGCCIIDSDPLHVAFRDPISACDALDHGLRLK